MARALEAVYELENDALSDSLLHFDFTPLFEGIAGYAWAFPYPAADGRKLWKVGVAESCRRTPATELRRWLTNYTARNGFQMLDERIAGWPGHLYSLRNQAHRPGLLLVGESHGIDPLLGEGIAVAFEMASFAALQLKHALDAGSNSIPYYEQRFAVSEEGRNLLFQAFLAKRLYGRNGQYWLRKFTERRLRRKRPSSGRTTYGRLLGRMPTVFSSVLGSKPRTESH
jgi:menaquinone-9 beta-reductase